MEQISVDLETRIGLLRVSLDKRDSITVSRADGRPLKAGTGVKLIQLDQIGQAWRIMPHARGEFDGRKLPNQTRRVISTAVRNWLAANPEAIEQTARKEAEDRCRMLLFMSVHEQLMEVVKDLRENEIFDVAIDKPALLRQADALEKQCNRLWPIWRRIVWAVNGKPKQGEAA
jgi:hypothetical protein